MLQILRDSIHVTRPQSIGNAEEVGRKEGISGRQEGNSNELHDLLIRGGGGLQVTANGGAKIQTGINCCLCVWVVLMNLF